MTLTPTLAAQHNTHTPAVYVQDAQGEDIPLRHTSYPTSTVELEVSAAADPAEATGGAMVALPTSYPPVKTNKPPRLNDQERKLRGDAMLIKRICGTKIAEIAREFQVAEQYAGKLISDAAKRSLIATARDKVLTLVPKAIAVIDTHLEEGDKDVGLEVLKGVGLLGRNNTIIDLGPAEGAEETFEAWRIKLTRKPAQQGAAPRNAQGDGEVIDVGIVSDSTSEGSTGSGEDDSSGVRSEELDAVAV
jgi:hypothetical protein